MTLSEHGLKRMKQRLKIKNIPEMKRRVRLAIDRGTLVVDECQRPKTICYEFSGFTYVLSQNGRTLITVYPSKKNSNNSLSDLREQITSKDYLPIDFEET